MIRSDDATKQGLHTFEAAGLGPAPYRFTGVTEMVYQACPGAPKQAGTNCQYCGTGIIWAYGLEAANGYKFHVGCDCIEKSGDAGLIRAYKTSPQHRAIAANKRRARDEANQAEIARLLAEKRAILEAKTVKRYDGSEESLYSNFVRCLGYCGAAGRARYLKTLRAA